MDTLLWALLCSFFIYTECQLNLCQLHTTTLTQSSTFSENGASKAKDHNLESSASKCATTDINQSKAWLQVDLGKRYSINSVKIYFRRQGDWKPYRSRQFYLDVSDIPVTQTTTKQRTRCYTDYTTAPNLPTDAPVITCQQTARYVIVETFYDAPEDNVTGAILEICEIEVYGCTPSCVNNVCTWMVKCTEGCVAGYHGIACDAICPSGCNGSTCLRDGSCSSCKPDLWGTWCNYRCSSNCLGNECHKFDARCSRGCRDGYFGLVCNKACSSDCIRWRCDQQTGACLDGLLQNGTTRLPDKANCSNRTLVTEAKTIDTDRNLLYGVIVSLCLSLVMNLALFIWNLRKKINGKQKKIKESRGQPTYLEPVPYAVVDEEGYDVPNSNLQ